jgi:ferredoxin
MVSNHSVKKRYKVVYERKNCIGAGSCISVFPERWKMNSRDDKADLIGGKEETKEKEVWIVEFTLDEFENFKLSAEMCPVNVIHIYDQETNEKII